jgi:hypothetical protein
MRRVELGAGVLVLCVLADLAVRPSAVRAEPGEVLLLPSSVAREGEGTPTARRASQQLARALASSPQRLIAPDRARSRFEQRGSTAPLMVSHGDLDALARDTQMALYHVASGLPGRARQDVERAMTRADKVLESLNRETLAAQQLLDACLYLVRAHLQSGERQAAREQALECRRFVPDIEPDGTMHPPDVIGILAEAEAELRQREPGSLRVESAPPGCAVYVNGRHLGDAPLELPQLSPGDYRVQAECEEGRAGRVHRVSIGSARVVKSIDTRFDAAIQTSLDIALHYDSPELQQSHAYFDAVEVGRVVGAAEVLLVLPVASPQGKATDVVQVDRVQVRNGKLLAAVRLRVDDAGAIEAGALRAAVGDRRAGQQRDHSGPAPAPLSDVFGVATGPQPSEPPPVASAAPRAVPAIETAPAERAGETPSEAAAIDAAIATDPTAARDDLDAAPPTTLGIVLGVAGGAITLTSWGLFARQLHLEAVYDDKKATPDADTSAALHDLDTTEYLPLAVAAGGAAVMTTSLPWLLPRERATPTWAWIAGGVGAGAAIAGSALLISGGTCSEFDLNGRCTDILATTRFGGLLLVGALPLLSVPLVYLLRGGPHQGDTDSVSLQPSFGGQGGQLTWRGQF